MTSVAGEARVAESGWAAWLGVVGEVHPAVGVGWSAFELDLAALAEAMPDHVLYEDVLACPAVRQDLAFLVDEDVSAAELEAAMREGGR